MCSVPSSCPEPLEEGVYTYDAEKGRWVRGSAAAAPAEALVFVNLLCRSGCDWALERLREALRERLGPEKAARLAVHVVVCTRFRYVCSDPAAKKLFAEYSVIASPSLALLCCGRRVALLQGRIRIEEGLGEAVERLAELLEAAGTGG